MTHLHATEKVMISVVGESGLVGKVDEVAVEEPLEIRVIYWKEGELRVSTVAITMRTPGRDVELAVGLLLSEGVISSSRDIRKASIHGGNLVVIHLSPQVSFDEKKLSRHLYTTSSCGVCGSTSIDLALRKCRVDPNVDLKVSLSMLRMMERRLLERQELFRRTGGLHASALFTPGGNLIQLMEDVGRHNAMDKLLGVLLLRGMIPVHDAIVMVSGRASFELVQKAAVAGIPILASIGAPTTLAIDLARRAGMTLISFLNRDSPNIYSGEHRVRV